MISRELFIGRWHIDFLFADDEYDIDYILDMLHAADASDDLIQKAFDLMTRQPEDTGFTYINQHMLYALVVIGPASMSEEFLNTLVHEIHHLAVAIAKSIDVDLDSETPAYIAGDSAFELAKVICRYGCDRCNSL